MQSITAGSDISVTVDTTSSLGGSRARSVPQGEIVGPARRRLSSCEPLRPCGGERVSGQVEGFKPTRSQDRVRKPRRPGVADAVVAHVESPQPGQASQRGRHGLRPRVAGLVGSQEQQLQPRRRPAELGCKGPDALRRNSRW